MRRFGNDLSNILARVRAEHREIPCRHRESMRQNGVGALQQLCVATLKHAVKRKKFDPLHIKHRAMQLVERDVRICLKEGKELSLDRKSGLP